jgi:hypothetical protein
MILAAAAYVHRCIKTYMAPHWPSGRRPETGHVSTATATPSPVPFCQAVDAGDATACSVAALQYATGDRVVLNCLRYEDGNLATLLATVPVHKIVLDFTDLFKPVD